MKVERRTFQTVEKRWDEYTEGVLKAEYVEDEHNERFGFGIENRFGKELMKVNVTQRMLNDYVLRKYWNSSTNTLIISDNRSNATKLTFKENEKYGKYVKVETIHELVPGGVFTSYLHETRSEENSKNPSMTEEIWDYNGLMVHPYMETYQDAIDMVQVLYEATLFTVERLDQGE